MTGNKLILHLHKMSFFNRRETQCFIIFASSILHSLLIDLDFLLKTTLNLNVIRKQFDILIKNLSFTSREGQNLERYLLTDTSLQINKKSDLNFASFYDR